MNELINGTSKYIKPNRENKFFEGVSLVFLFSLFVMPQYFGIPLPLFDLSILRITIIMLVILILSDTQRKYDFVNVITGSKCTKVIIPYLAVVTYTMILRVDINAFLNPFIEIFSMYLLIYVIKNVFGVEKTIRYILIFMYILTILGLFEYVIKRSPFSYFETIKGLYTGRFIRSGSYRIMGPCIHSLGYGLLLIAVLPLACLDFKENTIDILHRPVLFFLTVANIIFTGSRSTLSMLFVELILLFILSDKKYKKKFILLGLVIFAVLALFLTLFHNSGLARYILLQLTSIIDEIFGTQYSVAYGANLSALGSSSNYRDQLKYIFNVEWLNPIIGIGRKRSFSALINGSYVQSVDDFYIAEFIRYAYPGMIAYIFFIIYFLVNMLRDAIKKHSALCKILFAGCLCYIINLKWVDSLQTLKYLYIMLALYMGIDWKKFASSQKEKAEKSKHSKYIRR